MDLVLLGLTYGMANGLLAVGIVLVYKANRVINFAQGELGAFAVGMMLFLTRNQHWNYWAALAGSLAATALLAAIVERTVIQRLFRSPRLIVLVATLGVAQLLIVARLTLPKSGEGGGLAAFTGGTSLFPVPFDSPVWTFGRVTFRPEHFMALVAGPVVVLALLAFLRWTPYGIALRASAENAARARLLGIPVRRVSLVAWVVAGLVSGVAAILLAPILGVSASVAGAGFPLLVRGIACAALARMESVTVAFVAGLGLGVLDQMLLFQRGEAGETQAIVFAVIVIALLVRGHARGRVDADEASSWDEMEAVRPLPDAVQRHRRWRAALAVGAVVLVALAITAPFVTSGSITNLLANIFLLAVVAVTLTILTGWAGQLSLGQWAIAGVGGVFGTKLVAELGLSFLPALGVVAVIGGGCALLLGLPAMRLAGPGLAVVTLGFAVAASDWLFIQDWFRTYEVLVVPEWLDTRRLYFLAAGLLVLVILVARAFQRTRVGRNMVASRDNPDQAAAFGVGVVRAKLTAFITAGVFSALAGYLWMYNVGTITNDTYDPLRSITLVTAVVIGGLGSITGAVIGAFYFWGIQYFGEGLYQHISLLATGVGVLVLLMFFPSGFAGILRRVRDLLARRLTGIDPASGSDNLPTFGTVRLGADALSPATTKPTDAADAAVQR